jgi:aspartyl-tRNA(Asn)/glutamyl-tRNA(Gln) amidotransferase subunit C
MNTEPPKSSKSKIQLAAAEVEKIAKLAHLSISPSEALEYAVQLSQALEYFEQISQVDTTGVEPLVTPSEVAETWRPDLVSKEFSAEDLLANAPQRTGNLFTVPPVV